MPRSATFYQEGSNILSHTEAALSGRAAMQTVWSKTAQARWRRVKNRATQGRCICNCPSCWSTTDAIARRTTTATARRAIRVGDVFTLSFSSLAAGLAFAGSKKKDDRRKQWNKVIAEARASVEATEVQQQSRLAALSDDAGAGALNNTWAGLYDVAAERAAKEVNALGSQDYKEAVQRLPVPDDRNDTWLDIFDWAREQHKIREASGFQDWKGPPLSLLQSLSRAQLNELLSDERLLRRFYGGPDCDSLVKEPPKYPLSMKKLRTLEWSIAKMVLELLMRCSGNSSQLQEGSARPTNALLRQLLKQEETIQIRRDHINERLRNLHAGSGSQHKYQEFESPQAPNYDDITFEKWEQTSTMNETLQRLLKVMKPKTDLSELMSKICYNLLTARTPPNTHTYNMLLVRFSVLGREDLVKAVLTSMRESHIRPNEVTHATLMRHFIATYNKIGFVDYWRRMEGRHGGLALANPEQDIHPVVKERYHIFGRSHNKAAEKGRMNGQVYESLIVGAIQFLDGQTAMRCYRRMISEGWSPCLGILLAILQDCCHRLDWTVGIAVLEELEKTAERANTLTYEWMLRLCQCCGQQAFFDQILLNGVHCGALPASMLDLPDHANAEDVAFLIERAKKIQPRKAVGPLEKTAARIASRLEDKSPFLLENVFHNCEDEDSKRNTIKRTDDRWKARLTLQKKLQVISIDIEHTILQARRVLYASKDISSLKFWLSGPVKHLEKELEQSAKIVEYASYNDLVIQSKVRRIQTRSSKDGKREGVKLSVAPGFPKIEAEYLSRLPSGGNRPYQMVRWDPPSLSPMANIPDGSFWEGREEQMAATA